MHPHSSVPIADQLDRDAPRQFRSARDERWAPRALPDSVRRRRGVAAVVFNVFWSCVVGVIAVGAAEKTDYTSVSPQLSERAATALRVIQTLFDLSDWNGMATAAEALIATSRAGSYDCAVAHLYRAQAHLARGERDPAAYPAAITSLEHVVASGFWPQERVLDWRFQLAQLYLHEQRNADAERMIEDWLAQASAPTPQAYIILAGATLERTPVDSVRLELALTRVNEGLRLGARPNETLLYLTAACLQRLERWDDAAETLEFILSQNPRQGPRWEQLYAMYTAAARDLPAILTIERARSFGAFDSPQADIALGQHYHNLAQDHRALDALEAGLRRGVDDAGAHWIFAAYLAFSCRDFPRASHLLTEAEPWLGDDVQRRDHARLAEALATAPR